MRKLLFNLHLCAGLTGCIFLLCISLSGALIAFEPELNHAFHPALTRVTPQPQPVNWDWVRTRVEAESPGWKLIRFYFPDQPDESLYVRLRNVSTHRIRHIYVNQYTGVVLGSTEDGTNWIIKVHDLHVNLLSGKIGNTAVVVSTWLLAGLSLTGIVLWWPRKIYLFRRSGSAVRVNRDMHVAVGFWAWIPMLAFAATGIGLHMQTGKLTDFMNTPGTAVSMAGHGTSVEGMLLTAHQALPGAEVPRLLYPDHSGQPVFLYMRFPEDRTPAGRSFVTIDPHTGAVLSVGSSRNAPLLKTAFIQWTREIHTGTLFGLPSRILAVVFALCLAVLSITGPFLWWNKLRAAANGRRAVRQRLAAGSLKSGNTRPASATR